MKKSMDGGEISEQVHKQGLGNESYSMEVEYYEDANSV